MPDFPTDLPTQWATELNLPVSVPLNLEATLFCGQAFRWQRVSPEEREPKVFQAVVGGEVLELSQQFSSVEPHSPASELLVRCTAEAIGGEPLKKFVPHYLGLDDDVEKIFPPPFRSRYPDLVAAAMRYFGLRLMRQAPFETLISFMCAQGMGIKLIRRQVSLLARAFGNPLAAPPDLTIDSPHENSYENLNTSLSQLPQIQNFIAITAYKFPTPEQIAAAPVSVLTGCTNNNSIRAKNIRRVAEAVADGSLNLNALLALRCPLDEARETLMRFSGIGAKIADCVCLFGLEHRSAFPIDTHVRQYLDGWFGLKTKTASLTPAGYEALCNEAKDVLGSPYAGLAGQLLFHTWRRDVRHLKEV